MNAKTLRGGYLLRGSDPSSACARIWRAGLAAALFTVLAGCAAPVEYPGSHTLGFDLPEGTPSVYVQGAESFDVIIAAEQVGVVLLDDAVRPEKVVMQTLGDYGLSFHSRYNGGVYVFNAPGARTRLQIRSLALALETAEPEFIRAAGLVLWFYGGQSPLIVPDQIVIQFKRDVPRAEIDDLLSRENLEIQTANQFTPGQFLVRPGPGGRADALQVANNLNDSPIVEYAHPNFYRELVERQFIPNDDYFGNQWHLDNTGQGAGTVDADIDAPQAWGITLGDRNRTPLVAVLDSGFDVTHPDLIPNLWTNPGEIAGNGLDDDGNLLIDDINGWDFSAGDATLAGGSHGTSVAGAVGARGDNGIGVSGSCPRCQIMLVRRGGGDFNDGQAFDYARQMGAEVITNSWGYAIGTPTTANVVNAINAAATNGRGGLGSVILFAMNNGNVNDCGAVPDISSIANVIAVSRSTNQDQFDLSAYGDCMDVLSTSTTASQPVPARGTLQGMTTDLQGAAGYNTGGGAACLSGNEPTAPPANALDYTYCFDGTSFATPVAAGIAGLILSVDGTPTRLQVQRLIQDTADKTENSLAAYDPESGFSNAGSALTLATHGFGRVNAFEAVRIAVPRAQGGLGGVDIFLRDNFLDWGNTEQPSNVTFEPVRGFIGHWRSVDIKIDAPPYQAAPTTSSDFAALADEEPWVGNTNRVYVRVRNRGFRVASNVQVKLLWTQFGTALPNFPDATIWTNFADVAGSVGDWNQLGVRTQASLGYSGASVANTINDQAGIFMFDNFSPTFDRAKPNHFCLYAIATSTEDPVASTSLIPDVSTPVENNVTHRNVRVDEDSLDDGRAESDVFVRNPFDLPITAVLEVEAPEGWKVSLQGLIVPGRPFMLKQGETHLIKVLVEAPVGASGEVTITQFRLGDRKEKLALGGTVLSYRSEEDVLREQPLKWLEKYYEKLYLRLRGR